MVKTRIEKPGSSRLSLLPFNLNHQLKLVALVESAKAD